MLSYFRCFFLFFGVCVVFLMPTLVLVIGRKWDGVVVKDSIRTSLELKGLIEIRG